MNLNEEFEKETGLQSEMQDLKFGTWGYSQDYVEWLEAKLTLTDVVKSLEIKEEIVFEDWLKQHRFTKDINDYVKNNITYREWEVFNMYTMDVYNL